MLKGIWPLQQLDQLRIPSWQLGLAVLGASLLAGWLLSLPVSPVDADSILASYWSPEVMEIALIVNCLLCGASAYTSVIQVRTTEADLLQLTELDRSVETGLTLLHPSPLVLWSAVVTVVAIGFLINPSIDALRLEMPLAEVLPAYFASGSLGPPLLAITAGGFGALIGIGFAISLSQIACLLHAARRIPVDFVRLSQYSTIANPGIRLFLITMSVLSLFPLMAMYVNDPEFSQGLRNIMILMLLGIAPVVLAFFYPTLVLRNRIRDAKQAELETLQNCLLGNLEAAKSLSLQRQEGAPSTQELLIHQMFIESRWEWPVAAHIQKLILFGLLPPLTWVMAATIENLIY